MSGSRRRRRQEEPEEHENHERWMVTYADMVTLLMVLFIVMFAMSQVDQKKFMALKNGLAAGFANSDSVLPGAESILTEPGAQPMPPVSPVQKITEDGTVLAGPAEEQGDKADAERRRDAAAEVKRLRQIQAELLAALAAANLEEDVRTSIDDRGLVVSLVSRHVVFQANLAELSPRGARVVDTLGPVLRELSEDLEISGHTNQVKVTPKYFATDWDLSAARAVTVLRRLNERLGVPAHRLSVTAFGHTQPLEDPAEPGSQQVNKRVDIVVLTPTDAQTRELIGQLAAEAGVLPAGLGGAAGGGDPAADPGEAGGSTGSDPGTDTGTDTSTDTSSDTSSDTSHQSSGAGSHPIGGTGSHRSTAEGATR